MARSCFFLAEGMADGSLGKEIPLKSISDEVVFCHPILGHPKSTIGCRVSRHPMFQKQNTVCGVKENDR